VTIHVTFLCLKKIVAWYCDNFILTLIAEVANR
jgi:hypothetical protein